jgi:hypothetical protein
MNLGDYCWLHTEHHEIPPGKWLFCGEKDDNGNDWDGYSLIYFTADNGIQYGAHLDRCRIVDPVYGQIYPK